MKNKHIEYLITGKYSLEQELNGKIINGIPFLKVLIKGMELPYELDFYRNGIDAIFDTGANQTHITPDFAKILKLKSIRQEYGNYIVENGISKTNVFEIEFKIVGIENNFKEEFKELPYKFQYPLIFGTEFLQKCKKFNMDFEHNTYVLEL